MSSSESGKDIRKWMEMVDQLNEAAKTDREKNDDSIGDADTKIMDMKLDKLNMLIKKKYYEVDEETPIDRMFQFAFQDKGDSFEFNIPLNVLFGKKTVEFCANYWDEFFAQADISVTFQDNIQRALQQAGAINLKMKLNKGVTKEVEPENKEELDTEVEESGGE